MRARTSTDIAACVVIVAAALITLAFVWRTPPGIDRPLHRAIGEALARESLRLLGPGGKVLLITRDTEAFPQPALDTLVRAFQRELGKSSVPITATQLLQIDPLRPADVPSGDFFEMIRRAPAGDVIVSLLGPPLLSAEQRNKLGGVRPKIVAFCSGSQAEAIDLRELFRAGLLHGAVVSRAVPAASGKREQSPPRFEELYTTLRPGEEASSQKAL